jgi:hypothetical protein
MKLWHGSHLLFSQFNTLNWGNGAGGCDIGLGIYLAGNRAGGEYYAHYAAISRGCGYLYEVSVDADPDQLLDLSPKPTNLQREMSLQDFMRLREAYGDDRFTTLLIRNGIRAVRSQHDCNPNLGSTVLCIQPALIRIENVWKCNRAPLSWECLAELPQPAVGDYIPAEA